MRASKEQPAPSRTTAFRFEIYKDRSGSFHFRFLAAGGEVVFSSEAFQSKTEALKAIESIRANADRAAISDVAA
ncbi:YegP family protein [Aminobacter sp. Piv2-1]|uniref:YegP family protein n=1 Tax=Aminobacter sp. Piv2-1 TaxID=3031122 RepID=UPI0030B37369